MPPVSVLIKPVSGNCNLSCSYCIYTDKNKETKNYGTMSPQVIEEIIKNTLEAANGSAIFNFEGGEPTLIGLDFYERVVMLQDQYNVNKVSIKNTLSTNGLLIDDKWCRFLKENDFSVLLSLDGPEELHNKNRCSCDKDTSYERVMNSLQLLKENKTDITIVTVITGDTAKAANELYDFYNENGIDNIKLLPCMDGFGKQRGSDDFSLTPDAYQKFLKVLFDRWKDDKAKGRKICIDYFDTLLGIVKGIEPESCKLFGHCSCQFVFEADGSAFPCSYYVNDKWRMGNILNATLEELFFSPLATRFDNMSITPNKKCLKCEAAILCRGGCRRDRVDTITGEIKLNYFCSAYKKFLSYAKQYLVLL